MTGMQPTEQSSTSFTLRPLAQVSTPAADLTSVKQADTLVEEQKPSEDIRMFEAKWGRPFIADIYEMSGLGDFAQEELSQVNHYLLGELKARDLQPTKESYRAVLAELEAELGINPNQAFDKRLEKVRAYVEILAKQKNLELRKKLLENVSN